MPNAPRTADVIVAGAGIVGAATAYELALRGAKVTVLDQHRPGAHQSGRNWGFVRQQGRAAAELPLMVAANQRWQGLESELGADLGWTRGGNLALFDDAEGESRYRAWMELGSAHGIDTRPVDEAGVRALVDGWRLPVAGGIFAAGDGHADPQKVCEAYVMAASRHGATVHLGEPVRSLIVDDGRVRGVRAAAGVILAPVVVCAAGAWSRSLLASAGVKMPQSYVHGTVSLTTPQRPLTDATVWTSGFAFRQRRDGRLVLAAGGGGTIDVGLDSVAQAPLFLPALVRNRERFSLRPSRTIRAELSALLRGRPPRTVGPPAARVDPREARHAIALLRAAIADLDDVAVEHSWAGLIDSTPDGLPVIDHRLGVEGLVLASGFSGHGFGLGPAAGSVAAELAMGELPSLDLSALRFGRFAERDFHAPTAIL